MLDFVLTHEYMHFLHGDAVWSFIRLFCIALHWYNPLVWIAAVLSRNDGEMACDEGTIKRIGETERKTYGQMLIRMSCREKTVLQLAGMAICGSRKTMKGRILMINRKPGNTVLSVILIAVLMAAAVGCTFTGADKPAKTLRKVPVKETLEWGCTGDDIAKVFGEPQAVVTERYSTGTNIVLKYAGNIKTDLGTMSELNFNISDYNGLYCITGIVLETTYDEMEQEFTACYGETPKVMFVGPTVATENSDASHRENYSWDSLKLSEQPETVQEKIMERYRLLLLSAVPTEESQLVSVLVFGGPEQDGKYDVGINLDASLYIMGYVSQSEGLEETVAPTGYESGVIQQTYLYCQGQLYVYNAETVIIREELTLLGEVQSEDDYAYPHEEFASAHLTVGQKIYAEEGNTVETIFVQTKEGSDRYMVFVPSK